MNKPRRCLRLPRCSATSSGSYRFTHALVRSTLLDELSATRRTRVYRRAAVDRLRAVVADRFTKAGVRLLDTTAGLAFGNLLVAEAGADELLDALSSKEDEAGTQYHAMTYFQTYRERGALNELLPFLEQVTLDDSDYQGASAALKASAYATVARTEDAITIVDQARPFDNMADDASLPVTLAGFTDAVSLTGHSAAAAGLLPRLRELERADQDVQLSAGCFYFGSLQASLARVLSVLGEDNEAMDLAVEEVRVMRRCRSA